jgi:hypothetical protein
MLSESSADTASTLRYFLQVTKRTDQLVQHIAQRCRPRLRSELAHWIDASPRFSVFLTTHQDKVRKKFNSSDDEEHRQDVRAELLVAYLLGADRRFELAFEAYGARRLGPDLTVTFRANHRFNLEVTRLRTTIDAGGDPGPIVARLASVVTGKLRQLPSNAPNALVIVTHGLPLDEDSLVAAMRLLKQHADRKDDEFFARRGLQDARDFYARYLHFGGICILSDATAIFWPNREARHPLPQAALTALMQCLTSAGTELRP